jgi:hypothetical protein
MVDDLKMRVVDKAIAVMERSKHEHHSACPGKYEGTEQCQCGATALNDEIDQMISELRVVFGNPNATVPSGVLHCNGK